MTKSLYELRGEANDALFAHIPLPAGAITSCYWSPLPESTDDTYWRDLCWTPEFIDSETAVSLGGNQYSDGRIERQILVTFDNNALGTLASSSAARELAASLLKAADDFEGWTGR